MVQRRPFLIGILVTALLLFGAFLDLADFNEWGARKSQDLLTRAFPYEKYYAANTARLVLIAIDEQSIAQLGQWPWPRKTVAKIIHNLHRSRVAVVGVDVLFFEEDRYSPARLASELGVAIEKIRSLGIANGDKELARELDQAPSVIAFVLGEGPLHESGTDLAKTPDVRSRFIVVNDASENLASVSRVLWPYPTINRSAGLGFVNAPDDGPIREVSLVAKYRDEVIPNFGLEMLRVGLDEKNYVIRSSESGHALQIKIGDITVQTNPQGRFLFHHGHASRFKQIPAVRLFEGPLPELEGHIVIMGVNAPSLGDQHATPLEEAIPGAALHLQALDQMLSGRFITNHVGFDRMLFLACAVIACLVCYLIVKVPLIYSVLIILISLVGLIGISSYSFIGFGFVFNFFGSATILLAGALLTYVMQSIYQERLRKKLQASFAQYVPQDVVKRVSKSGELPKFGGELIEGTVLFLDLRGFTGLTEALKAQPELMVRVVGSVMDEVTGRLIESGATIDKYMGDAVMAFWNAPERQEDHLCRAIYSACRIQEDVEIIRKRIHDIDPIVNHSAIAFGIGICCGAMTVGNFGSVFRLNYTALGDAVNTASRLESMTKENGEVVLMAADFLEDGGCLSFKNRTMRVRLIGTTEIRGKNERVKIFTAGFI